MRNNPGDGTQGDSTLWKLTQAITAHARDPDDRRSRELHELSGMLMNRENSMAQKNTLILKYESIFCHRRIGFCRKPTIPDFAAQEDFPLSLVGE
jgi:hypothetical protein